MTYWDTSALLKLYVAEPDSKYFLKLVAATKEALATSDLARVEIFAALSRKELAGELGSGAAKRLYARFLSHTASSLVVTLPVGLDVLDKANELTEAALAVSPPIMIRSVDAIHVASATAIGAKTLIATDLRLRAVAVLAGLSVLP